VTKADEYEEDEGRLESQSVATLCSYGDLKRRLLMMSTFRQFLALVEFESKKKRKAAKSANEYMDKFTNSINNADQALKKRRDDLNATS
jgi:hypothetical protein